MQRGRSKGTHDATSDLTDHEGATGTVDVDEYIESSVVDALLQVNGRGKGEARRHKQDKRGERRAVSARRGGQRKVGIMTINK